MISNEVKVTSISSHHINMKWSRKFDLGTNWLILDRAERPMRAAEGGRRRRRPELLRRCRRRPLCASAPGSSEVMPAGGDVMCRCGGAPWSSTQQWTLVSWKDTLPVRAVTVKSHGSESNQAQAPLPEQNCAAPPASYTL